MSTASEWGIYVHVPWCRIRCPYCAFEIVTGDAPPPEEAWAQRVLDDHARWKPVFPGSPATLYFGGGTPSRVSVATLRAVREALGRPHTTVEANPEDLDQGWLESLANAGFERLSLGVQTLDPALARVVGRAHHDSERALSRVSKAGFASWSADLMFALPGQTLDDLERDLEALLAFDPPHVSIYGLTIEPGTGFGRLHERRPLPVPDDETWRAMYARIVERLSEAGLERYEVSNFARAGHESRHNRLYWTGQPYMGLGPSAHGLAPDGRRWANPAWGAWIRGDDPDIEAPDALQAATDSLVSGLRGSGGLDLDTLQPFVADDRAIRQLVAAGLLERRGSRIALSSEGYFVADAVVRTLVRGLVRPSTG